MSQDMEHDKLEALSKRMEEVAQRMEERIEEYLELSRSMEPTGDEVDAKEGGGARRMFDDTIAPFGPIGFGGGVAVGVPQFFDVNHLVSVNEAYGGIEDVWQRGRLAMWHAQMRIAQGAGDLEAMCLFLQLQLESLTQLALKNLYVQNGCWKRTWSADVSYERTEEVDGKQRTKREIREVRFEKGHAATLLPYHDFAFQIDVEQQDGSYFTVLEVPEEGEPFDGREFNPKSWNRFIHKIRVRRFGGHMEDQWAHLVTPVKSLRPVLYDYDAIWVTHDVFADEKKNRESLSKGRWAVAVAPHQALGVKLKIQEQGDRKFRFRAHLRDPRVVPETQTFSERTWRIYSNSKNAFRGSASIHEMNVRVYPDSDTGEFQWMMNDSDVISATTCRRLFKSGESYDVLGKFGKNHAHISKRLDMMMLAVEQGADMPWGEEDRQMLERIRAVRNLLAHGNLVKRSGRSGGLTVDDVTSFWDTHVQPRIPYWVAHIKK